MRYIFASINMLIMGLKMSPAYEQELVQKAKDSLKAFDEIYEYYLPRIFGYVMNRSGSREIAEDVTSQTFFKAMAKIKSFKYKGYSFGAWLYRIAHNNLMDYYRKNPNPVDMDPEDAKSESSETEKEAVQSEKKKAVLKILKKLPEQYQQVLSLRFFEEMTNAEMAEILGCRKSTLAVKLHRSLKAFKKAIEEEGLLEALNISL